MLGFSIMMWFVAVILCLEAVSLLRGNISSLQGEQFEQAEDKVAFGKAIGKIILFMGIAILACGILALLINSDKAMVYIVLLLLGIAAISGGWFILVLKRYTAV